jgi:hypothetical protein
MVYVPDCAILRNAVQAVLVVGCCKVTGWHSSGTSGHEVESVFIISRIGVTIHSINIQMPGEYTESGLRVPETIMDCILALAH